MSKTRYSGFWIDDEDLNIFEDIDQNNHDYDHDNNHNSIVSDEGHLDFENTKRLIRLSSARRAIANYVSILTGKNIPVLFNDKNVNCTDGNTVYLSKDITKKNNFDVAVGLSLHEASHIKYSDLELFKTVWMKVPREIYNYTEKLGLSKDSVGTLCKEIYNYVEDRYIDYTVHQNAPGYRGYYDALYDEYFNNKHVSDALKSELYKTQSIESYLFRIVNMTNKNTNLYALPGLYDIACTLDLSHVNRLKTPQDRLEVAYKISEIIFKNISEFKYNTTNDFGGSKNSSNNLNSESSVDENRVTQLTDDNTNSSNKTNNSDNSTNIDDVLGGTETCVTTKSEKNVTDDIGTDEDVSKTKLEKIKKAFQNQKDFLNGTIKKKKVNSNDKRLLDALEKSKVEILNVGSEISIDKIGVECIFVKNMTMELLKSGNCPLYTSFDDSLLQNQIFQLNSKYINEGIVMGAKIARRLQIRNEINTCKFSRRYTGKLDKRIIHELGYSDENIFYTTLTEKYKKINFHISVDASGSMTGAKWQRTMKLCVAIAKATTMLDNINLSISFRTTLGKNPYILIGFDSRYDKFSKVRNLFPYLTPNNLTPEGLCFEALLKYLPKYSDDTNSYFINMSDGEPTFNTDKFYYNNIIGANHTKSQVKKIRDSGYNVLSYFIEDSYYKNKHSRNTFHVMYGSDSNFIDVENIISISKTLNTKMMDSIER